LNILLVEDERKLAEAVAEGLQGEGYDVTLSPSGEDALSSTRRFHFDLILLDVMLPARSGLDVLGDMRRTGVNAPVLILTSRDSIEDRVLGLDAGADDYLVKPFAFSELLARIRALGRRGSRETSPKLRVADLQMDAEARSVKRGGQTLELTAREFELLEYLVRNQGHVVSREMLTRDVWKEASRHTPLDNVIDVHVARLRRKVDDQFEQKLVHTVRGVGFVVREERAE
jgi:DNA-binding response OmpR family regulator